jgi:hypothetical protein
MSPPSTMKSLLPPQGEVALVSQSARKLEEQQHVRSDFVNCVDNLYRQDFVVQHQHTTSDYLERVEAIKEEVTRPKLAEDDSESS